LGVALVLGIAAFFVFGKGFGKRGPKDHAFNPRPTRQADEATAAARQAVVVFDLEGAKSALSDLELEPSGPGETTTYLAQAVVKKEFLYDVEGAMLALQTARQQARNKRSEAEVDNLMAIYGFDRDPASSTDMLKRNLDSYKDDPVFRYNYALALLR